MPNHRDSRNLPYSARQMYDLVADIESYPQFLPWNSAARIRTRTTRPDGAEEIVKEWGRRDAERHPDKPEGFGEYAETFKYMHLG